MPESTPLDVLLDAARGKCDGTARRLAEELARARAAEDRLELLQRYRHDYEMNLRGRETLGLSMEEWRNYRAFMGQLDVAIEVQRSEIAARRHDADARRNAWSAARSRLRTFERLSDRREDERRLEGDRREQRQLDEQAARRDLAAPGARQ